MRRSRLSCLGGLAGLALLAAMISSASARPWKPDSKALAQDYSMITDSRPDREIVLVWWLVPPILGENARVAAQVLDQYFVLGVVHGKVTPDGTFSFDLGDSSPSVIDGNGTPMKILGSNALPPTIVGLLATLQASLGQGLGALGKGIQWNTFNGGQVRACSKGSASVTYAGETYTFETPIPGCS